MTISIFDLFSIGIGPSSSHTVGPMRAAKTFVEKLDKEHGLAKIHRIQITLYGSLSLTGKGHGTDKALILGLLGVKPEEAEPDEVPALMQQIQKTKKITLLKQHALSFSLEQDIIYNDNETLPHHVNGMLFRAYGADQACIAENVFYSIGGGFIVDDEQLQHKRALTVTKKVPYPYETAKQLMNFCNADNKKISEIVNTNELVWRDQSEIDKKILKIWKTMAQSIEKGCSTKGILPGGLEVRRRAPGLYEKLTEQDKTDNPDNIMGWLNCFAMAVNEENAAGGKVVTAPTNGASGIIPAVLYYHLTTIPLSEHEAHICQFLLTAAGIGMLYKARASISGAEVGCQGEVGVACSMAAGALAEVLGGDIYQVENAAEIGMEHHLGLTCDPINGLVQIPCIERNGMAAVRAVNAAKLALMEDGQHIVSLDKVIKTMMKTGEDMLSIYKETSQGGLAVNHPEC
jgi:L-serine dehydratase